MEAKAKSKARVLLRAITVVGTIGTAVLGAACSKETSTKNEDDQGIGVSSIDPVANGPETEMPVDATPSPDGSEIYFIAYTRAAGPDGIGFERLPAIFKVAATGGAPAKLHEGAPLGSPFGITISDDGQTLFIADSGADTSEDRSDGMVFSMGVGGGAPSPLAGTEGMAPGGVEAMGDTLWITGRKDGKAGLFRTGLGGGSVTPVAVGMFTDPSGVAVTKKGEAYVVDSGGELSERALASVVKVTPDGATEILVDGIAVGHPGGIALVSDDSAVLVSGLDPAKGTDVVFRVELGSRQVKRFSDVIGEFYESAGLHRARNADVFAWADSHANKTGTVYVLRK